MSLFVFIPVWVLVAAALIAGLVLGSFLNVCIVRLPLHQSIATPASHCVRCNTRLRARDNVPVISWIWLRGRCRTCNAPISLQYPLVEIGIAILFVACVLHTGASWQTLVNAIACFLLLGLAVMDWQTMLLPDSFTLTGIAAAFLLRVFAPGSQARLHLAIQILRDTAIAAGLLLLVWWLYRVVRHRDGLGLGDVKLLAMIAAFEGLSTTLFAFFVGVVAAALFATVLLVHRKVGGSDRIPFGSFLSGAAIAAIFVGAPAISWYLSTFR